jgi:uncharacterized protein (TIGR03435 family)
LRLKHQHTACTPPLPPQPRIPPRLVRWSFAASRDRQGLFSPPSFLVLVCFLLYASAFSAQENAPQNKTASSETNTAAPGPAVSAMSRSFDVASIRPNNYDHTGHSHLYYSPGDSHFRAINASVLQIVQFAYALPDSRILNAPAWLKSAKFDIQAESDSAVDNQMRALPYNAARLQKQKMVQALLANRFHLSAHLETRVLPIYALVINAKGVKLSPVQDGAKHIDITTRANGTTVTITNSSNAASDLADILTRSVGRIVVDKTGLQGNYTLTLKFASDDLRSAVPDSGAPDSAPSVFTALRDQLGLELKSDKAPIDVLVIDHIELPTEN